MIKIIKEKIIGMVGSVSGITSVLGSWQVCHNVCLGLIALLAILGISVVGMPLAFLTKFTIPFWSLAFVLLLIIVVLYFKKKCISKNQIMFNSGIIIAGIPFQPLQKFSIYFWIIGGALITASIFVFFKNKIRRMK